MKKLVNHNFINWKPLFSVTSFMIIYYFLLTLFTAKLTSNAN
jgi:hypothetical protein